MRKLVLCIVCLAAMMMAGTGLKAQEVTIVLNPGWTWISYPGTDTVDIATAFGSFTPEVGDIFKSKWGMTTYIGNGQWRGSLSPMFYPGYGYHYKSNRQMPVVLTFNVQQPAPQVVVTTSEPMLVTAISAMCGGGVTVSDGTYILVKGLCWAAHENPTTNDDFYQEAGSGVGSFAISMTNLNMGTTYYVRAYAVTPNGTVYGDQKVFTTQDGIPNLTTADVTDITGESATCGGNITDDDGLSVIARGVCWSTSPNPTVADSLTNDGSGTGDFISGITGLNVNTTYYVRSYAITVAGIGYGEQKTFTTRDGIPTLTTAEVTDITGESAISGGDITDDGGLSVIARGVCWSTTPNPTLADSHTSNGNGTGSFSCSITGLNVSTTYYVRAYASTTEGTGYGDEMSFTTRSGIPTLTTAEVTDISVYSATCGGTVTDDGGLTVITRGVCWNTVPNPTINDSYTDDGSGTGSFSSGLTGLNLSTIYYVRAYATTSAGTGYGEQKIFVTRNGIPTLTTAEVTGIMANSATSGGTVTDDGGLEVIAKGVCWSMNPNPTMSDSHSSDGTGLGGFVSNLTSLTPNTTYYVRAYATNSYVTVYGNQRSFTTELPSYTVTVSSNPTNGGTATGGSTYLHGQSCSVQAVANTGYTFSNWTENDSVVSTDANYTFIVNADRILVANFTLQSFTVDVSANPSNGGSVSGGDNYNYGQSCTLTATPSEGYVFNNWMENGMVVSTDVSYSFTVTSDRTLIANFEQSYPIGAINSLFTINSNGDQVYFSHGNLQYQASTNTWRFAENQYDFIGEANSNISQTYAGWIDLFGWGTSGWDNGNTYYHPWDSNTSGGGRSYGPQYNNLTGLYANADWGVYNPISNGDNTVNHWRTMTITEWRYVFYSRSTNSGIRYAKAKVNNINGVILLPDDWSTSTYSLSNTNSSAASFISNTITATQWITLESAGAVFLPVAGYRNGTSLSVVNSQGSYWSASCYGDIDFAYGVFITNNNLAMDDCYYGWRCFGFSVRLVRNAE